MRRRGWILALAAGLCGSLPACSLPFWRRDDSKRFTYDALKRGEDPGPPPVLPPGKEPPSPYAALPMPKTVTAEKTRKPDTQLSQVKYREPKIQEDVPKAPPAPPPQIGLELAAESESESQAEPVGKIPKAEEPALLAALRCFLNQQPQEAIAWLRRYDEPNQELLLRLLPVAVRLTSEQSLKPVDVEKGTAIVEEFNELLGVPPQGNLAIDRVCLCEDIKTFGNYKPFPDGHLFQPRDLVWIYVEVRNFTSVRSEPSPGDVFYETRLNTSARIKNFARTHEWPLSFHRRFGPDRSRTRRHDYWDSLSFNMPDLPPGRYTLEVDVEDGQTGRKTTRTVDFQMGTGRMASKTSG